MRKLAHIERIVDIQPIENADKIEVATVLGWKVIVGKGEHKVGEQVVYIEIDSCVPEDNPVFEFLADRHYKVKSIKLRGQISQGLVMPMSILPEGTYADGDEVTDILGIKKIKDDFKQRTPKSTIETHPKYKKMTKKPFVKYMMRYRWFRFLVYKKLGISKDIPWPEWVVKTDEERCQNIPWVLNNKEQFFVTEKLDGTSSTFTLHKEHHGWKFYVCSRNIVQPKPNSETFFSVGNVYWEMAKKYDIEKVLRKMAADFKAKEYVTIQGETIGEGIQGNKYDLKGRDLYIFNIIYDDIKLRPDQIQQYVEHYNMKSVPVLATDYILPDTIDELMEYSTGTSQLYDTLKEGHVYRNHDMTTSFKCVSNQFLLKWKA